jgi:outer membrane protein assembly factor BamB
MSGGRDLLAHLCTNCGAGIEVPGPGARVACKYCGQTFEAPAAPEPPPPPERVIVIAPDLPRVAARATGVISSIFSIGIVVLVVGAGAIVSHLKSGAHTVVAGVSVPGLDLKLPSLSPVMWDTVAGPPIPAAVGGGSVEGFVGRLRQRGEDQLWVAAFEGARLGQVWKVGPFGTYMQGYTSTLTGVAGHRVVVTDYKASVHVYDLATGHETHTLKLSDRAKAMCAAPDGKPSFWVEVADKRDVLVDAEAGTAVAAARPAWCPDLGAAGDDCRGWLNRGTPRPACRGAAAAPKINGFQALNVVEQGDLAVALGKKHPGTGVPMAVGFDPRSKSVRWEQPLPSGDQDNAAESSSIAVMDDLVGGRFVAPYALTLKGWHFTAFDARSGQRLWDTPLQPHIGVDHPEGFGLSADRLYVLRSSSLEVYDAKTGALVGTVGGD